MLALLIFGGEREWYLFSSRLSPSLEGPVSLQTDTTPSANRENFNKANRGKEIGKDKKEKGTASGHGHKTPLRSAFLTYITPERYDPITL